MIARRERQVALAIVGLGLAVTGLEVELFAGHEHRSGASAGHLLVLAGMVVIGIVLVWRGSTSAGSKTADAGKHGRDRDAVR